MRKKLHSIILTLVLAISACLGIGVNVNAADPINQTVEGEGNHFVTGKAYPTMIQFAGYDVTNKKYYVNFQLGADTGTLTSAQYYVEVFNDTTEKISTDGGGYDSTKPATADIINGEYTLSKPLTKNYSLIITVQTAVIAP